MKAKKILSALLAFAMIFSMLNISVFAEETEAASAVAKIGNTTYSTLKEAVTAANTGDTITLLQSINSVPDINKPITIKGEATDIAVNAVIAENFPNIEGTVTFDNLIFNQRISTENASSDQSKLTLKFVGCTFNVPAENTYAIQAGASWNNDVLGELYIENCTFTTNATSFVKGYMVYAQCVEKVTVKDSSFNGNNVYRGAIHLGDSTVYATTAVIEGNTITNTARGVQVGNRVEGSSLTINNNTFSNVNAISGETESASVYIHEVANAATTDVTYTNNKITESNNATPVIFSENATGAVSDFVSNFNGNTVNSIAVSTEDAGVYSDTVYVAPTPVEVATYAELVEALAAGGEIKLTADITTSEALVTYGVTATIDLNGYTLNVREGANKFNDASNITIKNGTINIDGVVVNGNAIFCLDEYEKTLATTVTLNNVNVEGTDYSSAYGIFYIGASSVLNVNGGTWTLSNDKFSAGGVFKADSAAATLNISDATMDLHNVRRVVTYANTTIADSTLKIYGDADGVDVEMEHGFNRSPLTVTSSTITMTDMVGRGITAECGAVSISENSTVTIENVQEATIDVRAGQTVTVSADSTVSVDEEPTITSGTISGTVTKVEKVAEVNGVSYLTLAEALEAAKDSKEIVVELLADATLDITAWQTLAIGGEATEKITISGNGKTLTFNKKNSDWNNIATNNNATLILNNMTITDSGYNNGPWNRYDLNFACDVELNGVTSTKALAFKAGATLNDVKVNESGDNYAIWIQPNGQTVDIDGLTVTSAGRGIKIDNQYVDSAERVNLSVSNSTFTTAKKAAILVKSPAGADIDATNVDITNVAADSTNLVWVDEEGASAFGAVTVTGANVAVEGGEENFSVAILSGDTVNGYYKDLHDAMVAAKSGETVSLLCDVDLSSAQWEPVSFAGKFNGNGYKIKNLTINKPGVSNTGFITSLNGTFENVTFENPTVTGGECTGVLAGRAGGGAAYAKDIKVTGTIKVETTHSGYARAGVIVGGWAYGKYENIVVDGIDKAVSYIKHTGGGDGRYVAGIVGHADDVDAYINCTVKNITISGGWLCGGIAGPGPSDGTASGCAVENIDMGADYSGGMFGWYYGAGTIENSSVKDVTFTEGSTNNGSIGGYSNNDEATVTNVTVENVKNKNGAPLLSDTIEVTYADGTVQYFSDILDAVPYTTNYDRLEGATIKLLGDYTGSGIRFMENDMVLDLNGFTYTINSGTGSSTTKTQCFQVRDTCNLATVKDGTIAISPKTERGENKDIFWVFNSYTNLDIKNVIIDCTNLDTTTSGNYVVLSRATTNLTGSTSIINFGDRGISIANTTDGNTNIDTTGKIEGKIDTDGTTTIKNGIFTYDVSEFCAEGFTTVQNDDGTYGVTTAETPTLNTKVFFLYNRKPMEAPAAIQEKYGKGNYYRVRLYAAIDGLDYSELGFKVAIDNGVNTPASAVFELENKVVYDTIKVTTDDGTTTLKPEQFNHTEDFNAKYLYALNVWVHENWGPETKLSVTPYAKDLNLKEFNGLVWGSDVIGTVQK